MKTREYMDKQIMDLSNSSILLLNNNHHPEQEPEPEHDQISPCYDFQPIRPTPQRPLPLIDSLSVSASTAVPATNYSSLDSIEPAKGVAEKDHDASNAALVSEIDRTMKKHADNLMHALEGVSARITQLETRYRNLENSVDDLKVAVGNNQGSTDGKLRQLENIFREVHSSVQVIRDKQDIFEGQLHLAKLQVSKAEHQPEPQGHVQADSFPQTASAPLQSHHQQPLPPTSLSPPNAPPQVHLANQYPPNQIPPPPQRDPRYPPPSQPQEIATQQYQPSSPLPPQQLPPYPPAPPQYSQPPPSQQHPSISSMNPPRHPEDSPYAPPQSYPPSLHQRGHSPNATNPSSQQFYGPPSHIYEPPSGRSGSGYSPTYGRSSGLNEPPPYPYSRPASQYGGGGTKQQISSSQLPTARVLPHALPTASGVGDGSGGSSGTGNKVPIDDVVDKVTNMGFTRDQVGATVKKLTENGQSVDLNIVLDKLMNDGVEGQPPRGWFGR